MPPTYLGLPREIRDMIHEYALTCSTELRYLEPVAGKRPKPIVYAAPQDCTCIHGYTRSTGMAARRNRKARSRLRKCTLHGEPTEFNQLKYVNWQLYSETAGLELSLNTLVFRRSTIDVHPCGEQASHFLTNSATRLLPKYKQILIHEATNTTNAVFSRDSPATLMHLDNICTTYPHIQVRYIMPTWRLCPATKQGYEDFLHEGMETTYALRRIYMGSLVRPERRDTHCYEMEMFYGEFEELEDVVGDLGREWPFHKLRGFVAPNLRFLPVVLGVDGKETTQLVGLAGALARQEFFVPEVARGQVEEWVARGI